MKEDEAKPAKPTKPTPIRGHKMVCVRVPLKMIKEADSLRKTVGKRTPYGLDVKRSDVLRVALSLGFEQLRKGN